MRQLFLQSRLLYALVIGFWLAFLLTNVSHAATSKVELTQLTWREVDDAITRGKTTIIIPIGGTEQNGSHMALDKHNQRVKILSERIALSLGNALVAPVVTYVPEGNIDPPTGHMRYPGTISISASGFCRGGVDWRLG
jgi:creatinine amidohydrolase